MPHKQKTQTHPEVKPGSERADIARRVANFKAHQAKLQQEREEYYQSVRARIGTALDGLPRTDAGDTPK
jgi:chorismate mutase